MSGVPSKPADELVKLLDDPTSRSDDGPMNELDLSHLLLEAFRSLEREIVAALEDRGASELRPSQAMALLLVDRAGTRLSDLAQRATITKQAMMQLVDDLQEMGCVRRVPDSQDARAKMVRLTAKGLTACGWLPSTRTTPSVASGARTSRYGGMILRRSRIAWGG